MYKKYKVKLSEEQRIQLLDLVKKGKAKAREIRHAHTLLMADSGSIDEAIEDNSTYIGTYSRADS